MICDDNGILRVPVWRQPHFTVYRENLPLDMSNWLQNGDETLPRAGQRYLIGESKVNPKSPQDGADWSGVGRGYMFEYVFFSVC